MSINNLINPLQPDPEKFQELVNQQPPFPVPSFYNDLPLPQQTTPFNVCTKEYPLSSLQLLQQPNIPGRLVLPVMDLMPLSPPFQNVQLQYDWCYRQVTAVQVDKQQTISAPYSYGVPLDRLNLFSEELGVSPADLGTVLGKLIGSLSPVPFHPYTETVAQYGVAPKGGEYICGIFEVWQVVGIWTLLDAKGQAYPSTEYYSERHPGMPFALCENQLINPWNMLLVYMANFKEK